VAPLDGPCSLHVYLDGGEGGGGVVEGLGECGAREADGELHPSLVYFEGRNEGEYFSVFFSNIFS